VVVQTFSTEEGDLALDARAVGLAAGAAAIALRAPMLVVVVAAAGAAAGARALGAA